jgi:hypothetical protein
MSEDGRIYVDAGQPATLLDGAEVIQCHTLQEAKMAWDRLPQERKNAATIRTSDGRVYTALEIDRLYYGPFPHAQQPPDVLPEVYEPPVAPAVSTNTPPSAGTAPESAASSLMQGQGGLHANPTVVSPRELARPELGISFREHAEQAERLAEALSRTIKREIERLENEGRNEPAWQDEIDFLKLVAATLDQIAVAIREARQATTQEDRERKFSKAETLAHKLAKAGREFAERNYARVIDYGGYTAFVILGTQLLVSWFGVPAAEALAAQLALLGLSGKK